MQNKGNSAGPLPRSDEMIKAVDLRTVVRKLAEFLFPVRQLYLAASNRRLTQVAGSVRHPSLIPSGAASVYFRA